MLVKKKEKRGAYLSYKNRPEVWYPKSTIHSDYDEIHQYYLKINYKKISIPFLLFKKAL